MNVPATNQLLTQIRQASQEIKNGRQVEALLIYDEVARQAGDDVAANVQLGHLSSELENVDQAIAHYRIAVAKEPDSAHFLSFLGVALQQNNQLDDAFEAFNQAIATDTELPSVFQGLGRIFMKRADYAQARRHLEKANQLKPSDASVHIDLATTLMALNDYDLALKHAETAVKQDASNPNNHYAVGKILSQLGRSDDAVRQFEKLIRQHRKFGAAYDFLARIKKFSEADKSFITKTEKVLQQGMPAEQRFCVHYALGKMYDDCGNWSKAFEHYAQANLLQKRPYSLKPERKSFKQLKKDFGATALRANRKLGHQSAQPIFIVGMPRSGTTLLEQMIASHPQAMAAGELQEMPRIAQSIKPSGDFRLHAEEYLSVLQQGRNNVIRIVDKLPDNFFYLGIVASLFPNATIIHAMRHPLDTCLSCYFQNFTNVRWACDLELIGERYLFYREVMDYWRSALPDDKIFDVHYEQLIDDPESQGRRLVDACGLEWDDNILQFHQEKSVVKSASLWQVRQAIYRSSKMRWKNYAPQLGRLAGILSPYLQGDREELASHGIRLEAPSAIGRIKKLFG